MGVCAAERKSRFRFNEFYRGEDKKKISFFFYPWIFFSCFFFLVMYAFRRGVIGNWGESLLLFYYRGLECVSLPELEVYIA